MAAYSATKAGLTAFDKAAAAEFRRRQIRVIDIRPTHTETGLANRPIAGRSPRLPRDAHRWMSRTASSPRLRAMRRIYRLPAFKTHQPDRGTGRNPCRAS